MKTLNTVEMQNVNAGGWYVRKCKRCSTTFKRYYAPWSFRQWLNAYTKTYTELNKHKARYRHY